MMGKLPSDVSEKREETLENSLSVLSWYVAFNLLHIPFEHVSMLSWRVYRDLYKQWHVNPAIKSLSRLLLIRAVEKLRAII